jgi:hypothetical protein
MLTMKIQSTLTRILSPCFTTPCRDPITLQRRRWTIQCWSMVHTPHIRYILTLTSWLTGITKQAMRIGLSALQQLPMQRSRYMVRCGFFSVLVFSDVENAGAADASGSDLSQFPVSHRFTANTALDTNDGCHATANLDVNVNFHNEIEFLNCFS